MERFGNCIQFGLIVAMVWVSWWLPRRWGWLGMFAAHLVVGVGWLTMGYVALAMGIWLSYDGVLNMIGLLLWAFLFNCLLLPVSGFAVRQRFVALKIKPNDSMV